MAIYKIFPEKDATIYSDYPAKNTGIDEILEVSAYNNFLGENQVARSIIKFSTTDITNVLTTISTASYDIYLKLYLANASALPNDYTLICHPISQSWEMGTGRYAASPEVTNGVSWASRSMTIGWSTAGGSFNAALNATQSFSYNDIKDVEMKVTSIVNDGSEGLLLKYTSSLEFASSSNSVLKFFSKDTHTIYPPCLEFRWVDYTYSSSLSTIDSEDIVLTLKNNKAVYNQDDVHRFRVAVRDLYPVRTFQTSSVYLNNKVLPTASYWALKNVATDEIVIDYDVTYTKLSADSVGNYFDLYMSGLEPDVNYKLIFKSVINNNTVVVDNDYIFKVKQ